MAVTEELLRAELKRAMLAKDTVRTAVIRGVLAALKNRAIEMQQSNLAVADINAVLKREVKQRRETLAFARQGGRDATVAALQAEIGVLEEFLPTQMTDEDLREAIREIATEIEASSIGPIMKALAERHPGQYDGKQASGIAAEVVGKR